MVFQKPTLFPWLTVEENIAFSLKIQKKYETESLSMMIIRLVLISGAVLFVVPKAMQQKELPH